MHKTFLLYPPGQRVHGTGWQSSGSLILVGLEREVSCSSRSVDWWALFACSENSRCHLHSLSGSLWIVGVFPHTFKMLLKHALDSTVYICSLDKVRRETSIVWGSILWWSGSTNLRWLRWARLTLAKALPLDSAWHERKGKGGGKWCGFFQARAPFLLVAWCVQQMAFSIFWHPVDCLRDLRQ